jgi:DNA-binding CsgD family transcriptional regulator
VTAGTAGTPTVGRERETARIAWRLSELAAGRGGVVLLSGEPGIGKTRLALDAAGAARARGLPVVWGRCPEAGGAPALWPWMQVVRACVRSEGADVVADRLGAAAVDVLALADVRELPGVAGPRSAELVTSQRFRMFDGVVRLLAGGPEPLVVVLEDLHRADELSVALARQLGEEAGQLPVLLMVTWRSTDAPADGPAVRGTAALASLPWAEDLPLGPLPRADAGRLVTALRGSAVEDAGVDAVVRRAGGNPLFLQQLARSTTDRGAGVPTSLRQVVRERVAGLPAECRSVLDALAVAGRSADAALVAGAVGLPTDRARALLTAAVERGLLAPALDEGAATFSHALVQEILYSDLDPGRRGELHERFAVLLEEASGPEALAARAEHALRAARAGRVVDCVPALRAAAASAAGRLAFAEASRLLGQAVERWTGRPGDLVEVLLELGTAEIHAGRPAAARPWLERAADLAAGRDDGPALAAAALAIGECVVPVGQVDWDLAARLRQALAALDHEDGDVRAKLLARLAVELYWHEGGEEARRLSADALVTAERLPGTTRTLAEAMWARLFTLRGPDRLDERLALGRRLVETAVRERWDDVEARGRVWWVPELLRAGQLPAYRANVERLGLIARSSGQPLHRWYAELFAAERDLATGAAENAAAHSVEAAEVAARLGIAAGRIYFIGQQLPLRRDVGGVEDIREPLQEVADRYPALVTLQMMLCVLDAETGQFDRADAVLARLAADDFAAVPLDALWTATLCLAAEVAAMTGDVPTSRVVARLLDPHRGTCAVQGVPVAWGAVDRAVGLARLTCGDASGARTALTAALRLHQRWGFGPQVLRTRLDLAVAGGLTADGRRDVERVTTEARALGLGRLADRSVEVLATAGPPRIDGPGGRLSPRETEVLGLLAAGVSNAGIAARLVLSVNTVERHVRNVYTKLGVANRAEAAAIAVRHDVAAGR